MHTQLETSTGHHEHPPQSVRAPRPHPVRRVGLLDRTALHLGVALIKWGRRPARVDGRERLLSDAEVHRARLEAERVRAHYEAMHLHRIL